MHLHAKHHASPLTRVDRPNLDDAPAQNLPLLIAHLHEHRVLPCDGVPRVPDGALDGQGREGMLRGRRWDEGIDMEAALTRRADQRTP
jgi:hypothetical protein